MDSVAVGAWGAYFGSVGLMFLAAMVAFLRSAQRVALTGSLSALICAAYVLLFLGWVPVDDRDVLLRLQAHMAVFTAAVLGLLLLWTLGAMRSPARARRLVGTLVGVAVACVVVGWALPAGGALLLGAAFEAVMGTVALVAAARSARRGDRVGWLSVGAVCVMAVLLTGLTLHAFDPSGSSVTLHLVAALCSIVFVSCMAVGLWLRYSYLIGLSEVMTYGPAFDPITRMRSHAETGLMLGEAFARRSGDDRALGVVVISIGNLYALEQLHGRAAYNHALFICGSRLRRMVPAGVEMGRLAEDGFLLLVRHPVDLARLASLARQLAERLARPVRLGTSRNIAELESRGTEWVADVGVGLMLAGPYVRPSEAVSSARAMSRTAWSYPSRVAWFDPDAGQIAELPPRGAVVR
jgi:GGDEF domain-containing protein